MKITILHRTGGNEKLSQNIVKAFLLKINSLFSFVLEEIDKALGESTFSSNFPMIDRLSLSGEKSSKVNHIRRSTISSKLVSDYISDQNKKELFVKKFSEVSILEFAIISLKFQKYVESIEEERCKAYSWFDDLQNVVVFISLFSYTEQKQLESNLKDFFSDSEDFSKFLTSVDSLLLQLEEKKKETI